MLCPSLPSAKLVCLQRSWALFEQPLVGLSSLFQREAFVPTPTRPLLRSKKAPLLLEQRARGSMAAPGHRGGELRSLLSPVPCSHRAASPFRFPFGQTKGEGNGKEQREEKPLVGLSSLFQRAGFVKSPTKPFAFGWRESLGEILSPTVPATKGPRRRWNKGLSLEQRREAYEGLERSSPLWGGELRSPTSPFPKGKE